MLQSYVCRVCGVVCAPLQLTLAKAYSDVAAFVIWGHQSNSPASFQNISIYISASSNYRAGVLCAQNVSMPDTRGRITVLCNATTSNARYLTFVKYASDSTTQTVLFANEIQPLRFSECLLACARIRARIRCRCQPALSEGEAAFCRRPCCASVQSTRRTSRASAVSP